jgi:ribosomal-protein-alanine N-acetyltransferase
MDTSLTFEKSFLIFPEIETDRLVLREITSNDAYSYHKHHSTIYDSPFWEEAPQTLSETKELIREIKKRYISRESLYWGIALKKENQIIGSCFFPEFENKTQATLGFWISQKHQQNGLMSETLFHLVDYAFTQMNLKTIIAGCHSQNLASRRVLEKCEFTDVSDTESKQHREAYKWGKGIIVCILRQKQFS